jgi:hypothetical protein
MTPPGNNPETFTHNNNHGDFGLERGSSTITMGKSHFDKHLSH